MARPLTSLDQAYGVGVDPAPCEGGRLYVDLDICCSDTCEECVVDCSYFFHPVNNGLISLIELATFALVCRRCENPHCVASCPVEALERTDRDGLVVRYRMRCVKCKSCSHACPYGTIYPEILTHLANICDYCAERGGPTCVSTCPHGALKAVPADYEPKDEHEFLIGDRLVVRSTHWERERA